MTEKRVIDEVLKKRGIVDDDVITIIKEGKTYELSEKRVKELTSKFIEACGREANLHDDFGMNAKVVELLIKVKQMWWPAAQKNIYGNVKDFDKQLEKWYVLQQDILEQKKKQQEDGIIVYDVVDDR